jgi:phosphomannomutase/phosphoglucomutase
MSQDVFREYDIRGAADSDLTSVFVERVGRALAELYGRAAERAPRIALGRDCRLSSKRLHRALSQGLMRGGAHVLDVGVGPTPMLYFGVHHLETDGGVMITGSHNPAPDNGLKMMLGRSPFFGEAIQELRALVEGPELPSVPAGSLSSAPVEDAYVNRMKSEFELERFPKIVIDGGNGAAGPIGLRTFMALGLRPVALFCDMDGTFPNHHPDPTVAENLEALIGRVRRERAELGIAWDGDGDRLGVVDEAGEIVWGDRLLALFAGEILTRCPGAAVVGDVKCSQTLFDHVQKLGGRPVMWKTGHSLIRTKMVQANALLAGEMSGHFFFADRFYGFDDGIYAALRLVQILAAGPRSLSELLRALPQRCFTPELRIACAEQHKARVVERMRTALAREGELDALDGVRVTYADGAWALVRASSTGPLLVLRFEAPTAERLQQLRVDVERAVADAIRSSAAS